MVNYWRPNQVTWKHLKYVQMIRSPRTISSNWDIYYIRKCEGKTERTTFCSFTRTNWVSSTSHSRLELPPSSLHHDDGTINARDKNVLFHSLVSIHSRVWCTELEQLETDEKWESVQSFSAALFASSTNFGNIITIMTWRYILMAQMSQLDCLCFVS